MTQHDGAQGAVARGIAQRAPRTAAMAEDGSLAGNEQWSELLREAVEDHSLVQPGQVERDTLRQGDAGIAIADANAGETDARTCRGEGGFIRCGAVVGGLFPQG